jgi:antitoxin FitA
MAQLLVRDLDAAVVDRLKQRATRHGRSLQKEVKAILEAAVGQCSIEDARAAAERIHQKLAGKVFSDSADLIREDRDR